MFTGIIKKKGCVVDVKKKGAEGLLVLSLPAGFKVKRGGSMALNGVCLTARKVEKSKAYLDCIPETFRLTTLGDLLPGERVNLELPLTLKTPLDGHLLLGHVDGVGKIVLVLQKGSSKILRVRAPLKLRPYFVQKGSVAVDGVSLTIVEIFKEDFSVALIPTTQAMTTLGRKKIGDRVNIEVDFFGKYVRAFLKV